MGQDARQVKKKFVSVGGEDKGKGCDSDGVNGDITERKISFKYIINKEVGLFIIVTILIKAE